LEEHPAWAQHSISNAGRRLLANKSKSASSFFFLMERTRIFDVKCWLAANEMAREIERYKQRESRETVRLKETELICRLAESYSETE
jgi:hypothetical protein